MKLQKPENNFPGRLQLLAFWLFRGRMVARQTLGRQSDWIILFLLFCIFAFCVTRVYPIYTMVMLVFALVLTSGIITTELNNNSFELLFTSRLTVRMVLLRMFFSLHLFLIGIGAGIVLLTFCFGNVILLLFKVAGTIKPDVSFDFSLSDMVRYFFHMWFSLLAVQAMVFMWSSFFRSQVLTVIVSIGSLLLIPRISGVSNLLFEAVLPHNAIIPFRWDQLVMTNRLILLCFSVGFLIIAAIRLRNVESFLTR